MLLFLFTLAFIRQLEGAPIASYSTDTLSTMPSLLFPRADTEPCAPSDRRTIWDIVWGCLITIFICTWIAVHPNIPAPTDSRWCVFKRGLSTMIYALIAPEFVVVWALLQYLGARHIMHEYNKDVLNCQPTRIAFYLRVLEYIKKRLQEVCDVPGDPGDVGWTKTHGFFIQMGGFILYRNGLPVKVLTYESFKELIDSQKIDKPKITERTINDKSKSDNFSKGFAVIQTTWFVVQCMTRWARSLPLVELEVVTLAFAVLNAITYALWINKPQNVQEAIRIDLKPNSDIDAGVEKPEPSIASSQSSSPLEPTLPNSQLPNPSDNRQSWLHKHISKDFNRFKELRYGRLWLVIYRIPYRLIVSAIRPMDKLLGSSYRPLDGHFRVPMFNCEIPEQLDSSYPTCLFGTLFGLLHVIAWNSGPTELEQQLWRCSTLVIIIEPSLCILTGLLGDNITLEDSDSESRLWDHIRDVFVMLLALPSLIGLPVYVIARVVILTQAFVSLRQLPPAAYCDVDWNSFIPHV